MKTSLVDRLKASENEIFGLIYIERKGAIDYSVSLENFGDRFAFVKDIKISGNHSEKYQTLIKKRILEEVEKEYGYVGDTIETNAVYTEYSDRIWFSPDITVIKTCPKDTWKKVATTLEGVDFFVSGDLVFTSNSVEHSKSGIYVKDEDGVYHTARFLTASELDSRQVLLYSLSPEMQRTAT
ncbi:hypothetical protein [Alicyclobacillus sp. SP_1]|uniref:hypothetical protein n=1 Tax=Alicyclobacillus sp. SP_1 TaxID=2942475 RepID=UPI0021589BD8|nr:hypothetical protein [Alicyclobacillus sp. SP_1]